MLDSKTLLLRTVRAIDNFVYMMTSSKWRPWCDSLELKVRIHGATLHAILRAMAKLHRVSTPEIVARNIATNIAD